MKTNPDHTAFPMAHEKNYIGLTKREYFAALAMQGYLANPNTLDAVMKEFERPVSDFVADNSVILADSLIAALNQEPKSK